MNPDQIYKVYCDQLITIENLQKEIARLNNSEPKENIKPSADEPAWKSWNWPMYTPATPRDFKANEKLSKCHLTKEEALAQYNWLKANSKRNKNENQ